MSIALDYTSRIVPSALHAAGATVVCRYIAPQAWKTITASEYAELRAAGIQVILNWESSANDWLDGATGGRADGLSAVAKARALGYPAGSVIVGSADFNATAGQRGAVLAYADAFAAALRAGGYAPGVYGPWDVLDWVAGHGGYVFFWQAGMSTAWSGGRNRNQHPRANLRQRGHKTVGGHDTDWNEIINVGTAPASAPASLDTGEIVFLRAVDGPAAGSIYLVGPKGLQGVSGAEWAKVNPKTYVDVPWSLIQSASSASSISAADVAAIVSAVVSGLPAQSGDDGSTPDQEALTAALTQALRDIVNH